jgi:uncharacterized protein
MLSPIMSILPTMLSLSFEGSRRKRTSHLTLQRIGQSSTKLILKPYRLILWLNNFPQTPEQRAAFEKYMEHGGGWMGFHVAGYNDESTKWLWFVNFMGGAIFYTNNWPPLPAKLIVDDRTHPVTRQLPATYAAPANEWYLWKPSPRLNKNVHVLVTLGPSNYPIRVKDIITGGDLPVVWTNTKYRMIYMNMGHGESIYSDATQNLLFANANSLDREPEIVLRLQERVEDPR